MGQDRGVSAPTHPVATCPTGSSPTTHVSNAGARGSRPPGCRARNWARDAPDRNVYTSNATGTVELYAWDRRDRRAPPGHRPAQRHAPRHAAARTARRSGGSPTPTATSSASGSPSRSPARPGTDPAVRRARGRGRLPGRAGDRPRAGRGRHAPPTTAPRSGSAQRGGTGPGRLRARRGRRRRRAVPTTRRCWRSRTPSTATRATRRCGCSAPRTAAPVAEKSDGAGPRPARRSRFAPVPGDQRLLVAARAPRPRGAADLGRRGRHRDRARDRPARRARRRLLPRRLGAAGLAHATPPAPAVPLRPGDRRAGPQLRHRRRAASARPTSARTARSSTPGRRRRQPPTIRALHPDGTDRVLLAPPGEPRARLGAGRGPAGCDGPGGRVHALLVRPDGADGPRAGGRQPARRPARRRRGPFSARAARLGWTPGSRSSRSTTAARPATAATWRDAHRGPARADRARGRRRRPRRAASPQGVVDPQRAVRRGLVVGRLPDAARPPARSRSAGRPASPGCRWPTTSPPTTTRWSSCGPSTGRCSAGHRRRCPTSTVRRRR